MDTLGYGAHLIVDGFGSSAPLHDEPWMLAAALELLETQGWDEAHVTRVSYWFPEGVSVGLSLPTGHLTLHTFAARQQLSLSVFNPQTMSTEAVTGALRSRFGLGRLEAYLGSRTVALPQNHERAVKQLIGERRYTDLRLDETVLTF
jgi:S-adenosylmethionine/arginine decarboxylase-like enzyme